MKKKKSYFEESLNDKNDDMIQKRFSTQGQSERVLKDRNMKCISSERFKEIDSLAKQCREEFKRNALLKGNKKNTLTYYSFMRAGTIIRTMETIGDITCFGINFNLIDDAEKALFIIAFTDPNCNMLNKYNNCPYEDKEKYMRLLYGFFNFDLIALEKYYSLLSVKHNLVSVEDTILKK